MTARNKEIDNWIEQEQHKHYCKCGCNKEIIIHRRYFWTGIPLFISGHNSKGKNNPMYGRRGNDCPIYGKHHSEETKIKMRNTKKNTPKKYEIKLIPCACGCGQWREDRDKRGRPRKFINGHCGRGKPMPDDLKKKLLEIHTGKALSEEHKKKIREALEGEKNPNYGKIFSKETRRKLSETHKGNISWTKGKSLSEETKNKISRANKNPSIETRRKMSESRRGIFALEKNPNWKGGKSFEPYCPKFSNAFKESIREKFGRICFLCPTTEEENGQKLSVHHVDYNKDCLCDDSVCEFVPLCISCHTKTNFNREYWENLILTKLGVLRFPNDKEGQIVEVIEAVGIGGE